MTFFKLSLQSIGAICVFIASFGTSSNAQQIDPNQDSQTPFASENAILDTGILFAIGAREAQQSLRGSFGWPTFQEGLVEGVYFRFDPDGYARFAPTPRLDTDVFEVICRPRTYSCMGRKGTLSIILNSRGQLQLKIDDVLSGDRFFVSEGVSEIEIPERILQPLDSQMESLLSTGGDLIVRRAGAEKDRLSLTGFFAVSAYLRWVAAHQDYTILPRNWPVPNAAGNEGGMIQATNWQSPMPQPQNFPTTQSGLAAYQPQTQQQPLAHSVVQNTTQTDVAEVKGELKILRELLLKRNQTEPGDPAAPPSQYQPALTVANDQSAIFSGQSVSNQITALQQAADRIQADIARLNAPPAQQNTQLGNMGFPASPPQVAPAVDTTSTQPQKDKATATAERLHYLMTEIGLDAKTAIMLIQLGDNKAQSGVGDIASFPTVSSLDQGNSHTRPTESQSSLYQDTVVSRILKDLERDLDQENPAQERMNTAQHSIPDGEYQLLSRYFKSVVLPSN